MDIQVYWHAPFDLLDTSPEGIYGVEYDEEIPDTPGVYIFARVHGRSVAPLYIGQATDLRRRVGQQLNNLHLMRGIENAPAGHRALYIGEIQFKRGQQEPVVLNLAETALISAALAEGYELLNIQGTNTPVDTITSSGSREARRWLPASEIHLSRT
ncbi:MAG TPA: hypothetical protein VMC86_05800 [Gemmatimonadales bacterium]|nr:hypothetical protein [Gemmatimonadales bacterium]